MDFLFNVIAHTKVCMNGQLIFIVIIGLFFIICTNLKWLKLFGFCVVNTLVEIAREEELPGQPEVFLDKTGIGESSSEEHLLICKFS